MIIHINMYIFKICKLHLSINNVVNIVENRFNKKKKNQSYGDALLDPLLALQT